MKLSIAASALGEALDVAERAVSKTSYLPALGRVLVEASVDGTVRLTGTDGHARAWHAVPADVAEGGSVLLPPKALADFLDAAPPDGTVSLAVASGFKAELACGRMTSKVAGLDPEGFLPMPTFEAAAELELAGETFARLVGSVRHAANEAKNADRAVLNGILVRATGGALTLAAADGYRLAVRTMPLDGADGIEAIVPAGRLAEAASRLAKAGPVRLALDAGRNALRIEGAAGCWSIALIDGQFPDYARIVPREDAIAAVVTVEREALLRSIRLIRGMVYVGEKGRAVMARLAVGPDSMEVTARDTDGDQEGRSILDATLERGAGLTVTFNGQYLRDAVEAIDADRVTLEIGGPTSPGLVREPGPRNGHVQVIMPMSPGR